MNLPMFAGLIPAFLYNSNTAIQSRWQEKHCIVVIITHHRKIWYP